MNWCEKHDHFKRTCPWCEVEELEQENKRLKELLAEKEAELKKFREFEEKFADFQIGWQKFQEGQVKLNQANRMTEAISKDDAI